jgi:hypothetical protein
VKRLSELITTLLLLGGSASAAEWFGIRVVDEKTGRGVPLVELETTHHVSYWTDSNGWAAIGDPEVLGQRVFFHVRSHGYAFPVDGFGMVGTALDVKAGEMAELKLKRVNIAERLCRLTGQGIERDSILLGKATDRPQANGQVAGQDSTEAVVFGGQIYWFWGDTNRLKYPLGISDERGDLCAPGGKGRARKRDRVHLLHWRR